MTFSERTYSALVVSSSPKITDALRQLLPSGEFYPVVTAPSAGAAKRAMLGTRFDIVIINAPLSDEPGDGLALDICDSGDSGVLLLVKSEDADDTAARTAPFGVLTVPKPIGRQSFMQAVRLMCATLERMRRSEKKYQTLEEKMEEIRIVDRAKWVLIERLKMSEPEAHRFIEKQAMDLRVTKRAAAESIIKTYEG